MKKLIVIAALSVISTAATAATDTCPTDLRALCATAANMERHEGILLQINPVPGIRFEQIEKPGFVSVNERGELAGQDYGIEGDSTTFAVRKSVAALKKFASKKREPAYVLITRDGRVLSGSEIK